MLRSGSGARAEIDSAELTLASLAVRQQRRLGVAGLGVVSPDKPVNEVFSQRVDWRADPVWGAWGLDGARTGQAAVGVLG